MKKLLGLLTALPIMITSCNGDMNEERNFGEFESIGSAIVSYNGITDIDLDKKMPETAYDSSTYKYSNSIELRSGDSIRINLEEDTFKDKKIEEVIQIPLTDKVSYCTNGTAPKYENLLEEEDGSFNTIEYLGSIQSIKVNKSIVDLTGNVDSKIENYNEYFDQLDDKYKKIINDCYDIGSGKTFESLTEWIKEGGWGGAEQTFFPILKSGGMLSFDLVDDSLLMTIGDNDSFADSAVLKLVKKDTEADVILTPSFGINLDKGTIYLQNNWRNAQINILATY